MPEILTKFCFEWAIKMKIWRKKKSFERMYFKSFLSVLEVKRLENHEIYYIEAAE